MGSRSAQWTASDSIQELKSDTVQDRLQSKKC